MGPAHSTGGRGRAWTALVAASCAVPMLVGCSLLEDPPEPVRLTAAPETASSQADSADSADGSAPGSVDVAPADVAFVQQMIPHHAQAVELAALVPERTESAELVALAEEIGRAQQSEIDLMTGWLEEWGLEAEPEAHDGDHAAEHAGPHGMDGMLDQAQLEALQGAGDGEFDRLWLEGMIAHHEGAVAMAEDVLADGSHGPTLDLARNVIAAQQSEIVRMEAMLEP